MKRHGNLWQQVISFEALLRAAEQARKGKRFRPAVASFHFDQERALWRLHKELSTQTYRPGAYRSFYIYERASFEVAPFERVCRWLIPQLYTRQGFAPRQTSVPQI